MDNVTGFDPFRALDGATGLEPFTDHDFRWKFMVQRFVCDWAFESEIKPDVPQENQARAAKAELHRADRKDIQVEDRKDIQVEDWQESTSADD